MTPSHICAKGALRQWIRERESVRLKRERGEPHPWTDDPVIGKYRFCNVRREDDRVTIWVRENIREPYADHPNLWFMLGLARWINWPGTLSELQREGWWPDCIDFSPDMLERALTIRANRGDKVFTGAYTINAPSTKGASKIDYVAKTVLGEPWKKRTAISDVFGGRLGPLTLRAAHASLSKYQGWGAFMSYQVVVDMRFTRYLREASDRMEWAAAGPGTMRGLNRLAGRRVDLAIDQGRALSEMRAIYRTIQDETGVAMDFSDVPNILCETDKYLRVLNGEGAPRALYKPQGVRHD